jgi:hypothetical protein
VIASQEDPVSPYPVLCFLVLAVFLVCLGLLALAVTKVVAPDGRGHARGPVGGFAAFLALLLLCGLGLAGLGATVAAIAVGSVVDWNPIQRIEISRADGRAHGDGAVTARFTVRGDEGGELVELVHDLLGVPLDEIADGLSVHPGRGADGEEFSVYEFRLPIREEELARFERELGARGGPALRLPERVALELSGSD